VCRAAWAVGLIWINKRGGRPGLLQGVLFGAAVPFGPGPREDGRPRSEYGLAATTLFVGFKAYF
jgi:hypothetical protein